MQVGEVGEDWFSIYLIPETLRVTVLGTKQQGDIVNLEIEAQTQVSYCTAVLALVCSLAEFGSAWLELILCHQGYDILCAASARCYIYSRCVCVRARARARECVLVLVLAY